jgi:raffinose/stachyose/melibiose transport system permease protein
MAILISLKGPNEMSNVLAFPKILHWQNFSKAWNMTNYPEKFRNTLFITIINVVFTLITNSAVGYAIARNRKKSKYFNFLFYYFLSAMFIPFSVIMLPLVKQASFFHVDNVIGITFLYIVFGLPMNTFLYHGYVSSIPEAFDEAATIDGASPLQVFIRIILPILKPMSATVAILSVMWTWNDFQMPLILLSERSQQTLQLTQYVFNSQYATDYNLAFASYVLVLFPILIIYILCQKWIISGVTTGAIKQ